MRFILTFLNMGLFLQKKILIVEDESLVALDIASLLQKAGYTVCATVDNGSAAIVAVHTYTPDLILMDICIEGPVDGVETAKRIGVFSDVPVIFLTAYSDVATLQSAIETSPEAYLLKPFKRQELLASVQLALFKAGSKALEDENVDERVLGNGYSLNRKCHQIVYEGSPINLTKKEMRLFELLLLNEGRVVEFSVIEYELWPDKEISETTRRTLIHRLRTKLNGLNIQTINGTGCILELPKEV